MFYLYFGYLAVMNALEFILMLADKNFAKKRKWRISEKTLLLVAIFGGALGGLVAMYLVRHKTKHWYFVLIMPLFTAVYLILSFILFQQGLISF